MTDQQPLTNTPLPVRLTVADYLLLDDAGAFEDYGKTELLEGKIFYMNSQHRPHAWMKTQLFLELARALESIEGLEAIVEVAISVPPRNVPEPDIVLTEEPQGKGLVPLPSVRLVVEVADTTVRHDLGRKAQIYAANGIPEYWVVDLPRARMHQLWSPGEAGYAERREIAVGERVEAVTIAGLAVSLPAG